MMIHILLQDAQCFISNRFFKYWMCSSSSGTLPEKSGHATLPWPRLFLAYVHGVANAFQCLIIFVILPVSA